jgi:hypothetical protein
MLFYQWLLEKCVVNTEFVANTLFTDEARVATGDIVNCHNTHIWMNDNPHTTLASKHQHRFSINIWVGILHVQILEPVVLSNRLTVALHQSTCC